MPTRKQIVLEQNRKHREAEAERRKTEDDLIAKQEAVARWIPDPVTSADVVKDFKYKPVDQGEVVAYGNDGPHRGGRVAGQRK